MEKKYVILLDESPVIFAPHFNHSDIVHFKVISAGKIKIYPHPVSPKDIPDSKDFAAFDRWSSNLLYQISVTHGSVSLKIYRDPLREEIDQKIIERFLHPEY
jgi:hypothetical protein